MFYKSDRVALFIDAVSFTSTARDLNMQVDYRKVREEFAQRGVLLRILFYAVDVEAEDDYSRIRKLTDFLSYNGYVVRTRSTREGENAFRKTHETLKMQMAMDMLELRDRVDHIVLATGDASMVPVVEMLQRAGMRVSILSSRASGETGHVADELRRAADNFIEMQALASVICREDEVRHAA